MHRVVPRIEFGESVHAQNVCTSTKRASDRNPEVLPCPELVLRRGSPALGFMGFGLGSGGCGVRCGKTARPPDPIRAVGADAIDGVCLRPVATHFHV